MKVPGWASKLWKLGVSAPFKARKVARKRKKERDLHGRRRGILSKNIILRQTSKKPHISAARGSTAR